MSEVLPQCIEHQKRLENVEGLVEEANKKLIILTDVMQQLAVVKEVATRTELRTMDFITSIKRIEFALVGDPEMQVDGLAKEHKQLKMDVETMKQKELVRRGWAAGAGAAGAAVMLCLKFIWNLLTTTKV